MNFSKSFPDELQSQIMISDVVSKRVALKKKGKDHWGLCPFHKEDSPSFSVNDQKGFYHCFGCSANGNIIGFVMNTENLGFKDAVIKLANDYSIPIPYVAGEKEDNVFQEKLDRSYLLLETVCHFFENNLLSNNGGAALKYLYERGLNNSHIKQFRLGFALDSYEALLNHLKSKSFSDAEILASGVITKNDNGKLYDKFRGRIIFPITNLKGKVIAFGGRIMGDGQPKYLNSAETELFKKGHNLYNFSNARKSIYDQKFVVVVEGYMDAISLAINGIENVVAPLGTALTLDQLQILFKITNDVVVCLDGDTAGIKAMRRTIDLVLPHINPNHLTRFAILPNGMDPDDFVRKNGKQKTKEFLFAAENLSKVLFDFEAQDLNINYSSEELLSPEKKGMLEAKLLQKTNLISDVVSRKHFFQYYKNLLFDLGKNKNSKNHNLTAKKTINNFELDAQTSYSIAILGILINFPTLVNYQDEFCVLKNLEFKNQKLSDVKDHLINFLDQNPNANFSEVKLNLEKFIDNEVLKEKIFGMKFTDKNLENITQKLQIFLLKYFHEEVSQQYADLLAQDHEIETDDKVLKDGKQKELFNYKTHLEKKILRLISDTL